SCAGATPQAPPWHVWTQPAHSPSAENPRTGLSAGLVEDIVLASARRSAEVGWERRAGLVGLRMCGERGLVLPQLQQRELVRIDDAAEHLELQAAGLGRHLLATTLQRLGELGALSGRRIE